MGNRVRTVSGWQESLRDQGRKMYIQTANPLEAGPSGPLSTKAPGQGIHTQAQHFPKHLPPGDNKPTSKPKKKNSSRMQREKKSSLPPIKTLESRAWQGAGAAVGESGFSDWGSKGVNLASSPRAQSRRRRPRGGCAPRLVCSTAWSSNPADYGRPLPKRRAPASLGYHRSTCHSPSCHKCHIPRKNSSTCKV